ncbi:hypothetical protein HK105_204116 [Polyrhizophydium stewartii]|uniref:Uncharacterized protein n=1 Tax=Polyrhizophydium stewartii TaxID=2732419 RepID=A0ABR4N9Z5_9FUNG
MSASSASGTPASSGRNESADDGTATELDVGGGRGRDAQPDLGSHLEFDSIGSDADDVALGEILDDGDADNITRVGGSDIHADEPSSRSPAALIEVPVDPQPPAILRRAVPAMDAARTREGAAESGGRQLDKDALRAKKDAANTWAKLRAKCALHERELASMQSKASLREMLAEAADAEPSIDWDAVLKAEHIDILKRLMESIESSVIVFKSQNRASFEELLAQERSLALEIKAAEERIQSWDAAPTEVAPPISSSQAANLPHEALEHPVRVDMQQPGLLPQVVEFQNYLARHGGHSGGWDDLSHAAFVKYRTKYGACDGRFVQACLDRIPGATEQGIASHEGWFCGYVARLSAKKRAIDAWRQRKKDAAHRIGAMIERDIHESAKQTHKDSGKALERREQQKEALRRWQEEKERRQHELEWEAELKARREREEVQRRRERQIKNKRIVSVYIQQRQEEKEQSKHWEEMAAAIKASYPADWKENYERLLKRDQDLVEKRRLAIKRKKAEKQAHRAKLDAVKPLVLAERDPDRVMRPTAGVQNRVAAMCEPDVPRFIASKFAVHLMPRRSVPSWRVGV